MTAIQHTKKADERRRIAAEERQARYNALSAQQKFDRAQAGGGVKEISRTAKALGLTKGDLVLVNEA